MQRAGCCYIQTHTRGCAAAVAAPGYCTLQTGEDRVAVLALKARHSNQNPPHALRADGFTAHHMEEIDAVQLLLHLVVCSSIPTPAASPLPFNHGHFFSPGAPAHRHTSSSLKSLPIGRGHGRLHEECINFIASFELRGSNHNSLSGIPAPTGLRK